MTRAHCLLTGKTQVLRVQLLPLLVLRALFDCACPCCAVLALAAPRRFVRGFCFAAFEEIFSSRALLKLRAPTRTTATQTASSTTNHNVLPFRGQPFVRKQLFLAVALFLLKRDSSDSVKHKNETQQRDSELHVVVLCAENAQKTPTKFKKCND